ncbi:MAG: hypothetical protein LBH09_07055, partial [Peptococcaceae bacterium]|nr:hypothetical protein [Peptococcaceae bacterium]
MESIESTNRLCKALGIDSEIKSVLHEHIYNCFVDYLENTDNTNKERDNNLQKSNKKTMSLNTVDKTIAVEPISLNLNNMRFFASENNGIKIIDSDITKNRCTVTYNRDFDNVNEPKAFAMVAYIYNNPTSWAEYSQSDYSVIFKGQLSLNIT